MNNTRPFSLLTVDDEEAIRSGVAAYFEDSGFVVSEASDGLAALELIREQRPDIVITDLRMPRMDGLELIDAVKAEFENLPIIVLSGTGVLADAIDALRRGAWDYLTKPIQDLQELEIIVHRSLERARLVAENRRYQTNLESVIQERTVQLRKLFAAVEQSANSVVITDADGVIEYANPKFCQITGYSLTEVMGKKPGILKSGHQPPELYEDLWNTIKSGKEWRGEFRNKRKNGTMFWEQCSIAPIRNEECEITNYLGIKEDITARKAQEEVLSWQASHDALTGLHNRYYLETHISSVIMKMDRSKQHLSVLLVDIDNLKFVNDTFGHEFGDHLLREISSRLEKAACPECLVSRFLGDEFVLVPVLSDKPDRAVYLAERVKEMLSVIFNVDGIDVPVTASIGVVSLSDESDNVDSLLRNAESAMYEAKRLGRNTIVFYNSEFHQRVQHRLMMERAMHRALENNDFSLHYQPQIDSSSGVVYGVEALLRWNTPKDMEPVSPAVFVPILEETSLIVPVGVWVLREACNQMVAWQKAGLPPMRLSVNISAVQFRRGDLVETVRSVLSESGFDPGLLCLELTESVLMVDTAHAQEKLTELRSLGLSLSLDDFGTGYSSLSYLSRMPVQELKVDQSFIRRIHHAVTDAAVVNTIIAMGQELGLELVAEGVETEEQRSHLNDRGCNSMQGFLFSRPLPPEEMLKFLNGKSRN